jgi:hypothetical protein
VSTAPAIELNEYAVKLGQPVSMGDAQIPAGTWVEIVKVSTQVAHIKILPAGTTAMVPLDELERAMKGS